MFDGLTASDLLRELLLNENSENSSLFTETEKKELIFQLFRIFVVGGALCQPDPTIERYAIAESLASNLIFNFV